jgi:hypothetical protein
LGRQPVALSLFNPIRSGKENDSTVRAAVFVRQQAGALRRGRGVVDAFFLAEEEVFVLLAGAGLVEGVAGRNAVVVVGGVGGTALDHLAIVVYTTVFQIAPLPTAQGVKTASLGTSKKSCFSGSGSTR